MYTIPNTEVAVENLEDAKAIANELAKENTAEYEVVDSETEAVAYVATPVEGRKFNPWERVETPKFSAPHLEGFRPAYQRVRISTVVYRAIDESGWLVLNLNTNERVQVRTTAQARAVTNRMADEA